MKKKSEDNEIPIEKQPPARVQSSIVMATLGVTLQDWRLANDEQRQAWREEAQKIIFKKHVRTPDNLNAKAVGTILGKFESRIDELEQRVLLLEKAPEQKKGE